MMSPHRSSCGTYDSPSGRQSAIVGVRSWLCVALSSRSSRPPETWDSCSSKQQEAESGEEAVRWHQGEWYAVNEVMRTGYWCYYSLLVALARGRNVATILADGILELFAALVSPELAQVWAGGVLHILSRYRWYRFSGDKDSECCRDGKPWCRRHRGVYLFGHKGGISGTAAAPHRARARKKATCYTLERRSRQRKRNMLMHAMHPCPTACPIRSTS